LSRCTRGSGSRTWGENERAKNRVARRKTTDVFGTGKRREKRQSGGEETHNGGSRIESGRRNAWNQERMAEGTGEFVAVEIGVKKP